MLGRVRKAVFPVAGLGTRFLPATKAVPKEMLPVIDRPIIQYAVEEAIEAGIEQLIFVTGRNKSAIEDHFDVAYELESVMSNAGKDMSLLNSTRIAPGMLSYVRQQQPLGLGHAVWCARDIVGDEPFAVLLPDELMIGRPGCLSQMVSAYEQIGGNFVCGLRVSPDEVGSYGVIDPGSEEDDMIAVKGLVEKPSPAEAPSNLIIAGRYILQPEIFALLGRQGRGAGGEIQLTDSMARMIGTMPFHAVEFDGRRFDCGSKIGYLEATLMLAMERPDLADATRAIVADVVKRYGTARVPEIVTV